MVLVSDRVYIKRVASRRAGEVAPKGTRSRLAEDVGVSEVFKSRIDSDWNRGREGFCPDIHGALERCPGGGREAMVGHIDGDCPSSTFQGDVRLHRGDWARWASKQCLKRCRDFLRGIGPASQCGTN